MRAMKCCKRLTAFLLSFVMVLGLVLTNGITSEAARKETAWTEDGEIEVTVPSVMYKTHVQSFGWEKSWKKDGQSSGTFGKAKRLEAIQIHVDGGYGIGIEYRTHVQSIGWQGWKHDGQLSGTSGQSKRLEAIQIRLTGNNADLYDVYYRVHAQTYGWMGWVKNGEPAGTAGQAKRLEAIQIIIVQKWESPVYMYNASGESLKGSESCGFVGTAKTNTSDANGVVTYKTHVQRYGDQSWVSDGSIAGTSGEAKRLEAIYIKLNASKLGYTGGIRYKTHVQSFGWEKEWKKDGQMSGTSGEAKRLEAIQIRLTGTNKNKYDIYYRVQAQTYGWLGWVKNGAYAGTAGQAKRLEAIQIIIMPKTDYPTDYEGFDGTIGGGFVDMGKNPTTDGSGAVSYMTHVQSYGNQKWVSDGSISGTSGEGKRLEAISIKVNNAQLNNISGGIAYTTHVQTYGWSQGWKYNGAASGTRGEGKRLEAIRIQLTGQLAQYYDVYYRVHAQTYGWPKNGSIAGTSGLAKRLEAIQIVIIPKGEHAPNPLPAAPGAAAYVH